MKLSLILCAVGLHKWGPIKNVKSESLGFPPIAILNFIVEIGSKDCTRCGKEQKLRRLDSNENWKKR